MCDVCVACASYVSRKKRVMLVAGSSSGTERITLFVIMHDSRMNSDVKRGMPGAMIGNRAVRGKRQHLSCAIHEAVQGHAVFGSRACQSFPSP